MINARSRRRQHATAAWMAVGIVSGVLLPPTAQATTTVLPASRHTTSTLCDVVQSGSRVRVAWLSAPRVNRPTKAPKYQELWIGSLTGPGKITERHRLTRNRVPLPPLKIISWSAGCPALIPTANGGLEAVWQRARISYYPGNLRVGASSATQLVHAIQTPNGRWQSQRPWRQAGKIESTSRDAVRWLGGGSAGNGVLLVQRRMKSGADGLKLYSMRRAANGRWGPFMRDIPITRDIDARTVAGDNGRLAILVSAGRITSLQTMGTRTNTWSSPKALTSRSDECRIDGLPRLAVTSATIYAAWTCILPGGSFALTLTALDWNGNTLQRAVIDDRRTLEASAIKPADAPSWVRAKQPISLGSVVADGSGGARVSWMRATPYALEATVPDLYETTMTRNGVGATQQALVGASLPLPPRPEPQTAFREVSAGWYGLGIGRMAENFGLLVSDMAPVNVDRTLLLHRDPSGAWHYQQHSEPLEIQTSGGGRTVFPIEGGFALSTFTSGPQWSAAVSIVP